MKRFAMTFVAAACVASAAPASAQVIFAMDYGSAAAPEAGWTAVPPTAHFTRTRIPGGGPNGQDAVRARPAPHPGGNDYGGQFYWGWRDHIEASDPSQGSRRYYRWRMWFSPNTNFRGLAWSDGHASNMTNKLLMIGDNCGSRCRFILTYKGEQNAGQVQSFRLQLDGGVDLADTPPFPIGQWLNIQIELQSGSSSSSSDGSYKIWINNNNYSSPTAQRTGIVLRPTNWRWVFLGAYMNDGLASNGVHTYRQTDFQVATSFNANWASGGGGSNPTPPTAPANVRIVTP